MSKRTLAILFGGKSSEHEVSRRSAAMAISKTPRDLYDIVMVGITKEGRWFLFEGDPALIPDGSWENDPSVVPAAITPDSSVHGLTVFGKDGVRVIPLDAVYPVLHGKNGEDGTVQGLLELAEIPYVGCNVSASAVCMDKGLTNTMLEAGGIPQARFVCFTKAQFGENSGYYIEQVEKVCGWPCFVKPANAGSSVGVSKCASREELDAALTEAFRFDPKVVIEEGIVGSEVECAVLGNAENAQASVVGEIVSANDWYDYESKYNGIGSETLIPANISEQAAQRVRELAVRAYRLLGCSGLTRMDFFVRTSDGEVLLNEPNTLPGFTEISMYPMLWAATGINNAQLIDRLVTLAIERMAESKSYN